MKRKMHFNPMQAILGKRMYIEEIPGFENAYIGENRLSSTNQAEAEAFSRTVFDPLLKEVAKLAKNDDERQELTDYMMAKHGLERNEVMAERKAVAEVKKDVAKLSLYLQPKGSG